MGAPLVAEVKPPPALPESLRALAFQPPPGQQGAIQKIRYTHDAMIDKIIADPWVAQGALAAMFGYTEGWVSQVIASDAFQARLAARKSELVDPYIKATLEERFKGLAIQSLDKLRQKLEQPASKISDETLLRAVEISSKALGYGAKMPQVNNNVQFVVHVPPKAKNSEDWAATYDQSAKPALTATSVEVLPHAATAHAEKAQTECTDTALGAAGSGERTSDEMLEELLRA